jgi:hypothetical protein
LQNWQKAVAIWDNRPKTIHEPLQQPPLFVVIAVADPHAPCVSPDFSREK